MDEQDNQMKRDELLSRRAKLSPSKQALLEKRRQGKSLGVPRNLQASTIERVSRDQELPLTFALESLLERKWSSWEVRENNINICFRLTGAFNEEAMELTVNELAHRHETFRTRFPLVNGRPAQVIVPSIKVSLPVVDLQDMAEAERLGEAVRVLAREAQRPYDLSLDILWRVLLVRLAENDHILLLGMSHLISDSWSMGLLTQETLTLYSAFSTGQPSPLAELPIQFADYAYWQRKTLQGQVLEELVSYWKNQLEGLSLIPEIRLPIERPLPAEKSERTILSQHLELTADLSASLKELSRREDVTLFMLLVAALVTVLHRYTGGDDFGLPTSMAKRDRPETRGVIGPFADFSVLRVRLSGVETFSGLLQRVRSVVLEAYDHQDLPFAKFYGHSPEMWDNAEKYPSVSVNIYSSVNTVIETEKQEDTSESRNDAPTPEIIITPVKLPPSRARNAALPGMTLVVKETGEQLNVVVNYESERYEAEAIRELLENYRSILESIIVRPGQRLSEFPLIMKTVQP